MSVTREHKRITRSLTITRQLANSPTNSQTHRLTDSPTHQLTVWRRYELDIEADTAGLVLREHLGWLEPRGAVAPGIAGCWGHYNANAKCSTVAGHAHISWMKGKAKGNARSSRGAGH